MALWSENRTFEHGVMSFYKTQDIILGHFDTTIVTLLKESHVPVDQWKNILKRRAISVTTEASSLMP